MAAALQIWSATFSKSFDTLPGGIHASVQSKIDEMGTRLESFPHQRLQGRPEFKLRAGDYRVLYEFDLNPKTEIKTANLHQSGGHKRFGKISPDHFGYGFDFYKVFLLQHLDASRPF